MTKLTTASSKINFRAFIWHSGFLALASNFMDVDTIIPSMLIKAGGNSIHLGFMTAIMLGGSSLFQLVFAGYLSGKPRKKKYLLTGINLRVGALLALSVLFLTASSLSSVLIIALIFLFISIFSFSGAFANVSYVDILGKSVLENKRKKFFSLKQIFDSIGLISTAFIVRELVTYFDYPKNYFVLFLIAGLLLLVASLGFWRIQETSSAVRSHKGLLDFFRMIPGEIRNNSNLKYYLLLINTLGLTLSLMPFFILFAKDSFGLTFESVGNFLLFRTIGMLAAGIILFKFSSRFIYKHLLIFLIILGAVLPLISLMMAHSAENYHYIFILTGIYVAIYKVTLNGVLLEISTDENRATYAGISGAGNILTTLFPLFAGVLISAFGYFIVFLTVTVVILVSFGFVFKLDCRRVHPLSTG